MAILLNVPFSEKDEAKKLGAWWNPELKKWYIKDRNEYIKLKKWISPRDSFFVVCDHLYIIQGENTCFKCGQKTRVIGYGIESYMEFDDEINNGVYYDNGEIVHIAAHIKPIPSKLMDYIQHTYNYKNRYSKFANRTYLANCCDNCDVLQGDFFLFDEVDSPFWIENSEVASKLNLFKISLEYDIVLDDIEISFSSTDYLIKQYAHIEELVVPIIQL